MLFEVDHVDRLLLPRLLGLLKAKELIEDILMGHDTSVVPPGFSLLAAWLPLHLFLNLFGTHISDLTCAFGDFLFSPYLTEARAAAALLKCRQLVLQVESMFSELIVRKREQRL